MAELLPCPGCHACNGVLECRGDAIDRWNENAENAAGTGRIRTFAKKYDDLIAERDRLQLALIKVREQARISFFSDCGRGVEKCFAMQHIREIIDIALTEDKKNE